MKKINLKLRARNAFLRREFSRAMNLFNEILQKNPKDKEAKLHILICDIMSESFEHGAKIYEYYQILKSQKIVDSEGKIIALIRALDELTFIRFERELEEQEINYIDGILFSDFKKLAQDSDFKTIFAYTMLSTKIVFLKKSEFYEFLNLLIDNEMGEISLQYIDNHLNGDISMDFDIQQIISRALKKS